MPDSSTLYWIAGGVVLLLLYRGGYLDGLLALLQRPAAGTEKASTPAAPTQTPQASTPQTVVIRVEDGRAAPVVQAEQSTPQTLPPGVQLSGVHTVTYPATVTTTVQREGEK